MISPEHREVILAKIVYEARTSVSEVRAWCAYLADVTGDPDLALRRLYQMMDVFKTCGRRDQPKAVPLSIPWMVDVYAMRELARRA